MEPIIQNLLCVRKQGSVFGTVLWARNHKRVCTGHKLAGGGNRKTQFAVVTMAGHLSCHCFEKVGIQNMRGSSKAMFELGEKEQEEANRSLVVGREEDEDEMGL